MAITRDPDTNDDGTGTTGTIRNAEWKTQIYDRIDAAIDGVDAGVRTVPKGGTGVATLADKGVLYGNAAAAVGVTAVGSSGQVLTSNGAGVAPTFQTVAGGLFTEQTTALTGAQNNFNLSATLTYLRCTGAAPVFSGFTVAGAAPTAGCRVVIYCLGTTAKVTNQDVGSTAENRIITPSTAGQIVGVNGAIELIWDATTARWRMKVVEPGAPLLVAHNAGDYTASGTMTWTVEAADLVTYAYVQTGKKLFVTININASSVGGTLSTELRIALPSGFTITRSFLVPGVAVNAGTIASSYINPAAAGVVLRIYLLAGTNWSAATNNTNVLATCEFEVD